MNKKREILSKIIRNKYFIAPAVMLVWVLFFDSNTIFSQMESRRQLRKLVEETNYYKNKISEVRKSYKDLSTDSRTMEKYARERYFMKKENEEVFLIQETSHSDTSSNKLFTKLRQSLHDLMVD